MKTKSFTSLILLFVLLFSANLMPASAGSGSVWVHSFYDIQSNTGMLGSMELDSNDRINILYIVPGPEGDEFRLARQTAGGWEIEIIATVADTSSFDLALDSNDNPHFVFRNRTPGTNNLGYYRKEVGGWVYQDVTSLMTFPDDPVLQIDQSGNPHLVAYVSGAIHYLFWNGTSWIDRIIPQSESKAWLVLDSQDNPAIAYGTETLDIAYATWEVDHWAIQDVDTSGMLGLYLSLALDSSDQPHIAYWDFQTGNLKYAHRIGETEWNVSTVGGSGRAPSIAIDSVGNPHIVSFSTLSPTYLQYSYWNGSTWEIEQVTSYPEVIAGSLRLTKTDRPWIIITQNDTNLENTLPQKILFKGYQVFIPLLTR